MMTQSALPGHVPRLRRSARPWPVAATVAALVLVVSACGGSETAGSEPVPATSQPVAASTSPSASTTPPNTTTAPTTTTIATTTTTLPPTAFPGERLDEANAAMSSAASIRIDVVTIVRTAADAEDELARSTMFGFGSPADEWLEADADAPNVEAREIDGVRYAHDPDDGEWRIDEEFLAGLTTHDRILRTVVAGTLELVDAEATEVGSGEYRIDGTSSANLGSQQVSLWRRVRDGLVTRVLVAGPVPAAEYSLGVESDTVFVESTADLSEHGARFFVVEPPTIPTLLVEADTVPIGFHVPVSWEEVSRGELSGASRDLGRNVTAAYWDADGEIAMVVFEDDLEDAGFGRVSSGEFADLYLFGLIEDRQLEAAADVTSTFGVDGVALSLTFPDLTRTETFLTVYDETRGFQILFFGPRGLIEDGIDEYISFVLASPRPS